MRFKLTLALLVALILRANYHYFAVSFDNLAFVAHRFYGRSDFHNYLLVTQFFAVSVICGFRRGYG